MNTVRNTPNSLAVIDGGTVEAILAGQLRRVQKVVKETYLLHGAGSTVNPASQALRFPHRPSARIMSLPAHVGGPSPVTGMKWISSFPENLQRGLPRASAVVILNDEETGRPYACIEGSQISAARTAASAVVAGGALHPSGHEAGQLAICGAGFIARYVWRFLVADEWNIGTVVVFDTDEQRAGALAAEIAQSAGVRTRVCATVSEAARDSDIVLFTTTALAPHVSERHLSSKPQLVLHVSLRDLLPDVILSSQNIVDDPEHAFRDGTSLALARASGQGQVTPVTIDDVLRGRVAVDVDRRRVFSPFGLGVLDLTVAALVYEVAVRQGQARRVPNFFPDDSGTLQNDRPASPLRLPERARSLS